MNPVTSFLMLAFLAAAIAVGYLVDLYLGLVLLAVGLLIGSSLKMANVWQKFVILRLGKLQSVRGAGLFAIIPIIDSVNAGIQTTALTPSRR
jgi:regulator of protease activity HflC (stomatin/prohibitin superfamily)